MFSIFPLMTNFTQQLVVCNSCFAVSMPGTWNWMRQERFNSIGDNILLLFRSSYKFFSCSEVQNNAPGPSGGVRPPPNVSHLAHLHANLLHKRAAKCIFIFQYRYSHSS